MRRPDGETLELEANHRRHAEVENAIRDLKCGVGLNHMPSGRFAANGAWLAIQVSRASTKHTSGAEQKCTTREVIGQRKCPRQLFGRSVTEAGWQQAGRVSG